MLNLHPSVPAVVFAVITKIDEFQRQNLLPSSRGILHSVRCSTGLNGVCSFAHFKQAKTRFLRLVDREDPAIQKSKFRHYIIGDASGKSYMLRIDRKEHAKPFFRVRFIDFSL